MSDAQHPCRSINSPAALLAATRAELLRLRKWPVLWVMLGVGTVLNILFGYVFDYVSYRTDSSSNRNEGRPPAALLNGLLPAGVPETTLQGMPMFGGALLLILAALAVGSGYGWGTWKTIFTQGRSRASAFGGTLAALASVVVGMVAVAFLVNFGISLLIAAVESEPLVWPLWSEVGRAVGGGLLIYGMWAACGVLVGALARSPALAVGLGLVWALAVENLLRATAHVLRELHVVTDLLPGTAAGSLAGALGAPTLGDGGAPGVLIILDGGLATLLLAVYMVAFAVIASFLITRRDTA